MAEKTNAFIAEEANRENAYLKRSDLTSVVVPEGVTEIGDRAFMECSGLTEVVIPESVTKIGYGAFWGTALVSVTIPEKVKKIGECAFCAKTLRKMFRSCSTKKIFAQWNLLREKNLDFPKLNLAISNLTGKPPLTRHSSKKCSSMSPNFPTAHCC